jgi:hypothetical protein
MDASTINHVISAAGGIIGGLSLLIGPRLKGSSRPRWVIRASSVAGILFFAWGSIITIQLMWGANLSARFRNLIEHYEVVLGCTGLGILITLFISGELRFRK